MSVVQFDQFYVLCYCIGAVVCFGLGAIKGGQR